MAAKEAFSAPSARICSCRQIALAALSHTHKTEALLFSPTFLTLPGNKFVLKLSWQMIVRFF